MNIHSIHHIEFEKLGMIHDWISKNKHILSVTHVFNNDAFPVIDNFDALIIMGGPMSVYEEDKYPWIKSEKKLIINSIKAGKKVIGICLGAQMIANALGSKVYKNTYKEIGWFPVYTVDSNFQKNFNLEFPNELKVFHWHGDTFDLPKDSVHLFKSEACINQGFFINDNVLGLQFHLEMDKKSIEMLINNAGSELKSERFIQTEIELLQNEKLYINGNKKLLFSILDNFLKK